MGLLYETPNTSPAETPGIPEAPAGDQTAQTRDNDPVETSEPQEQATESTDNGTEVEGGAEEEDSTSKTQDAQKSEEKPPAPPKTIRIGDEEIEVEKVIKAYETHQKAQELKTVADRALRFIGESPKQAFLTIFAGKLGTKEKAQEAWNKLAEETVIENWKRANEPEEARLKRELEEHKKWREEQENALRQKEKETTITRAREQLIPLIKGALKSNGQDPEDPGLVGLVAQIMAKAANEGEVLPAEEAVPIALERLDGLLSVRLKAYPKERLLGLRPELKGEIVQESIQAVKQAKAPAKTAEKPEPKQGRFGPKVVSQGEFRKMFS